MGVATGLAVLVALVGILWTAPFFLGPATGGTNRTIGLFPDQSSFIGLLLVHGWILVVFSLYLGRQGWDEIGYRLLLGGAVLGPFLIGLIVRIPAVTLIAPLLVLAWILLRTTDSVGFETVLFVAGAGLVLLVEFVYLDAQAAPGRMNTVFKTYMHIWVLWGTGAAVVFTELLPLQPSGWSTDQLRQPVFAVLGVMLLLTVSLYGGIALGAHVEQTDELTLDATRWAQEQHSEEWAAIQFLAAKLGQPTIVTAPACWCNPAESVQPYRWANAPSSFTGIPTVAGWAHEVGYRGQQPYRQRVEDVRTIYTGSEGQQHQLLDRYNVRYIYIGPNERALYDVSSLADHSALTVVFQNEAVTVYRVAQREIDTN